MVFQESFEISFPSSALMTSLNGIETEPKLIFISQTAISKTDSIPNTNGYESFLVNDYLFKNAINLRIAIPLWEMSPFSVMLISAKDKL